MIREQRLLATVMYPTLVLWCALNSGKAHAITVGEKLLECSATDSHDASRDAGIGAMKRTRLLLLLLLLTTVARAEGPPDWRCLSMTI